MINFLFSPILMYFVHMHCHNSIFYPVKLRLLTTTQIAIKERVAENAEQDQAAHMCKLIFLYTFKKKILKNDRIILVGLHFRRTAFIPDLFLYQCDKVTLVDSIN